MSDAAAVAARPVARRAPARSRRSRGASNGPNPATPVGRTSAEDHLAAGIASRRLSEELIAQGRVVGQREDRARARDESRSRRDEIKVDGRRIKTAEAQALHPALQAARLRHDAQRSAGTADGDGPAARREGVRLPGRPARLRLGGAAAPHQRRRAGGAADASAATKSTRSTKRASAACPTRDDARAARAAASSSTDAARRRRRCARRRSPDQDDRVRRRADVHRGHDLTKGGSGRCGRCSSDRPPGRPPEPRAHRPDRRPATSRSDTGGSSTTQELARLQRAAGLGVRSQNAPTAGAQVCKTALSDARSAESGSTCARL